MAMIKRLQINLRYVIRQASKITVSIYAILAFLGVLVSFERVLDLIDSSMSFWMRLLWSVILLVGTWLLCFLGVAVYVVVCKRVKVVEGNNGKAVYVQYGDLFSPEEIPSKDKNHRRSICFAVNRCFDTIVDDRLISSASIHGKAFKQLYQTGIWTADNLNEKIQASMAPNALYETLSVTEKPQGNLKRYSVGTGADVEVSALLHYFLIGLSSFDSTLTAHTQMDEYCLAIQRMIEFCDRQSQGFPVVMPIIGGFLARTGQKEAALLEYMVKSFKMNVDHINSDIYIVVREDAKNAISIFDLKN